MNRNIFKMKTMTLLVGGCCRVLLAAALVVRNGRRLRLLPTLLITIPTLRLSLTLAGLSGQGVTGSLGVVCLKAALNSSVIVILLQLAGAKSFYRQSLLGLPTC